MLQLFKDNNNQFSMMRFQSLIVVITACIYAFIHNDIAMTAMLLTYGFGGKYAQKHIEMKSNKG
jgi:hypothetical protein